jgi:hypothetical protein
MGGAHDTVFAAVAAKRAEWGLIGSAGDAFNVAILGGAYEMAAKGVACTAFRTEAHAQGPSGFCLLYGLSRSARFEISAYGEESASRMCKSWSDRMNWYYELYVFFQEERHYVLRDIDVYIEPEDFTIFAATRGGAADRVAVMRSIRPSEPTPTAIGPKNECLLLSSHIPGMAPISSVSRTLMESSVQIFLLACVRVLVEGKIRRGHMCMVFL